MARFYKAFIFFLTFPFVLYPQPPDIKFEHLSVKNELSNSVIHCILQDSKGFIWIATMDGLNKFDGYKFTVYRNDPADSTSIGANYITNIYEGPSAKLWLTTVGGGLNKFDPETEKFTRYMRNPDNPAAISCNDLQQTTGYRYGDRDVLWIGACNGLNKFDMATEKFTHYPFAGKYFPDTYVETIAVDSLGLVWVGCTGGGLYKFDPETEQYTGYTSDPDNPFSLSDNKINYIWFDKSGILWVGTEDGGLNKFEPETGKFTSYLHDPMNQQSLSSNFVLAILEDRAGTLWIGTADGGLNTFERETGQFTRYLHDPGDPSSLGDNSVMTIYEDKSGVLWIGTWGGISKIDPGKAQFSDIKQIPGNPNSLSSNYVWSIFESDFGGKTTLWVGTKTDGLNKLDRATGNLTHYQHDPATIPNSIPGNVISALLEDRSGMLWIGTYGDGLIKYNQQAKQFTRYLHNSDNPNSISGDIIRSIIEDKSGLLWIGTQTAGLNSFDRKTGKFVLQGRRMGIQYIYEDKSGLLWFGGFQGLQKLNRETGEYANYRHNPDNPNSINDNTINVILETGFGGKDVIWVGTAGGINRFDPELEKFYCYTTKDGLPNDVINGILEDNDKNLWLSTNNGLSRFNPETETFRNYDVYDGLLSDHFNPGVCLKSYDGALFFGGVNGLNYFYPDRLKENLQIPEIVITDFQIFNESVTPKRDNSMENKDVYFLPKHISALDEIELSYKENIFSFEFAALDYRSPQKNKYAYLMEGVDPDWVNTDASRRFATYTNLDPGEYVFRVKGSNNDGLWNKKGTSITIIITPPWWRTNLAYSIYIFFLGFIVFGVWRFQTNRLKMKHELDLEHVHAEKLEEVDRMKSRFFANISHEFRTPLTLIKGPVKQMLNGEFIGNVKDQYKMILRNSDRLLNLINQILDLSKLESGEMKLQVSETQIIKYLKGMVFSFASLAERKNINLQFKETEKSIVGFIDRDKLEKIMTNLLSNAFKFTPEGGKIVVDVSILQPPLSPFSKGEINPSPLSRGDTGGCIQISITNTGAGISTDRLDKIFDRFYQTDDNYKKDSEGTGIGLALTKELVEAHHGSISVSSNLRKHPPQSPSWIKSGTGFDRGASYLTTFTILLPLGKEHLTEDEILDLPTVRAKYPADIPLSPPSKGETDLPHPASSIEHRVSSIQSPASGLQSPLVLIVEDNPDVISYISSFLENDYRILTAENGKEGLKKALAKYPDLIISDVMMPEMDGFELCKKVKSDQRTSHIPVILLTAKADLDSRIEGLEFGADDYISKPFEADELKMRSKNLIEQRRKLRKKFSKMADIKPGEIAATSMDKQFLQRLLAVFNKHISEPDFSSDDFAREVGMSRSSLHRKLQALTNHSTNEFIRTLRLKRAAQLLKIAVGSISEVAYSVGFNNQSYFAKIFRQQFGQSPGNFANHHKQNQNLSD